MSYFPLDRDLLSSSTWAQGTPEQIKVWIYLLLAADPRTGIVEDADPGVALRCGLSLEVTTEALDWLAGPDPYSRRKDQEGRRIERLPDGGIRILNYARHRDRDYSTPRVRAFRERQAAAVSETAGNGETANQAPKRSSTVPETTDTDTDTDTERPLSNETASGEGGSGGKPREPSADTSGSGRPRGSGTATARELATLQADETLADLGHHWCRCFRRPAASLGVLRAARKALAGGYEPDALKLVIRVASAARASPERFPERGSLRWAVEHGKIMDPSYILRPDTLDKLISEAEEWDRA